MLVIKYYDWFNNLALLFFIIKHYIIICNNERGGKYKAQIAIGTKETWCSQVFEIAAENIKAITRPE